ncbi:MAG: hypothetical protein ABI402_05905 [Ferruginibacter sp.]
MNKYITYLCLLISFHSSAQINSTNDLPSEKQIIEIIKSTFGYPKEFPDQFHNITITFGTKTFPLKTKKYYKKLVENKVVRIVNDANGIYNYEITEGWRSTIINRDEKLNTVTVKVSELELISLCKPAIFTGKNQAEFCLYVQFNITPFYDFATIQPGAAGSWMIENVQVINENGTWKLTKPAELKIKIKALAKPVNIH